MGTRWGSRNVVPGQNHGNAGASMFQRVILTGSVCLTWRLTSPVMVRNTRDASALQGRPVMMAGSGTWLDHWDAGNVTDTGNVADLGNFATKGKKA
jgi:hypothetical protein